MTYQACNDKTDRKGSVLTAEGGRNDTEGEREPRYSLGAQQALPRCEAVGNELQRSFDEARIASSKQMSGVSIAWSGV